MANVLKPKRSNTASNPPTTSNTVSGELAVNMADQKIYINNGTAIVQIGSGKFSALGDVVLTGLASGNTITWNGTNWVNSSGGISRTISSISTNTTAGSTVKLDYVYLVSGTTTLTLPTAVANTNLYTVKNVGVGTVTVATSSSQTIDGAATAVMSGQYNSIDIISDNVNWNLV